jgi:hypothetical protein
VTYRRDKGHGLTGYVETLADIGIPKAMTMSCVQAVDVLDASQFGTPFALERFTPTYEIEVVWLVP